MEAAQRIRLIRIIEKMEKNPTFSNKLGIKKTDRRLIKKKVLWRLFPMLRYLY